MRILKLVDGSEHLVTEREAKTIHEAAIAKGIINIPRIGLVASSNNIIMKPVPGQTEYGKPWLISIKDYGGNSEKALFRGFEARGDGILYRVVEENGNKIKLVKLGTKDEINSVNGPGSAVYEDDYYDYFGKISLSSWPNNILDGKKSKEIKKNE